MARRVHKTSSVIPRLNWGPFADICPTPVKRLQQLLDHSVLPDFICSREELFAEVETALMHIDMVNWSQRRAVLDHPAVPARLRDAVMDNMRKGALQKLLTHDFSLYCQIKLSAKYADITAGQSDELQETGYRFYTRTPHVAGGDLPSVYASSGLPRHFSRN